MWRGENQHHAEQQQIHEIDNHEGKECPLICEIGLIFRNHPAAEREMKCPRCADDGVKQAAIRLHVEKETERAVSPDRHNAIDWEKIRCQRDPEVGLGRHYMSAVGADAKSADMAAHQPDPQRVSKLVPEHVN